MVLYQYSDLEASKILSAHEGKQLIRHGEWLNGPFEPNKCNINQAAYVDEFFTGDHHWSRTLNPHASVWFDQNYDPSWTIDQFVKNLTKKNFIACQYPKNKWVFGTVDSYHFARCECSTRAQITNLVCYPVIAVIECFVCGATWMTTSEEETEM